jgi:hypothetical protein
MNAEKSCLVKISDDLFLRKSDVLVITYETISKLTVIGMKHQGIIKIDDLTPQQVMNRLDGIDVQE